MKRPGLVLVATMLLLASCDRGADVEPEPQVTQEASPSPTTPPSFQLDGRVLEASGSAEGGEAAASPAATATATTTPTANTTASPGGVEDPAATTQPGATIEQAAPGSLALRVSASSGENTGCVFSEGDTVVVLFTRATSFQPGEVTQDEDFPNNLVNGDASIGGQVLDEQNCVLVSTSISVGEGDELEPTPTARATGGARTTGRRATTPPRRVTPTPTRRVTPTPTAAPTTSRPPETTARTQDPVTQDPVTEDPTTEDPTKTEPDDEGTSPGT